MSLNFARPENHPLASSPFCLPSFLWSRPSETSGNGVWLSATAHNSSLGVTDIIATVVATIEA
jgi:hypothetical protein